MQYFIENGCRITVEVGTQRRPLVVRWTTWHGRSDLKQSYLLVTPDGGVLIDPIEPAAPSLKAFQEFVADGFIAVVVTTARHERDIEAFRERFKIPIYGPKASPRRSRFVHKVDEFYATGDDLPGGIVPTNAGDPLKSQNDTLELVKVIVFEINYHKFLYRLAIRVIHLGITTKE